jgi:hypothetical protein
MMLGRTARTTAQMFQFSGTQLKSRWGVIELCDRQYYMFILVPYAVLDSWPLHLACSIGSPLCRERPK